MDDNEFRMKYESHNVCVVAWAEDFTRALYERPRIIKALIRLLLGKYAYRELWGLNNEVEHGFIGMEHRLIGYSLQKCEYHKDKIGWL